MIIKKEVIKEYSYQALDLLRVSYWRTERKLKASPEDKAIADELLQITKAIDLASKLVDQIERIPTERIE